MFSASKVAKILFLGVALGAASTMASAKASLGDCQSFSDSCGPNGDDGFTCAYIEHGSDNWCYCNYDVPNDPRCLPVELSREGPR
jgi:hypothetical protein